MVVCKARQSHYIEVAQGGVSSKAILTHKIDFEYLAYFEQNKFQKDKKENIKYILQRMLQCFLKNQKNFWPMKI